MKSHRISAGRLVTYLSLGVALAATCSHAIAQNLGTASGYSYFVFGDVHQTNAQSKGAAAIGGNATFSNYGIGEQLPSSSNYALVVDGNLNFSGGSIFKGNALVGGTATLTGVGTQNGSVTHGELIDFSAEKTGYTSLSDSLAGQDSNSSYSLSYGNLIFTGADATLNTFIIQSSDFSSANSIAINAPSGSTVVINVGGDLVNFDYLGINVTGTDKTRVLYNFFEATTLNLAGLTVQGSILAPNADVNFSNGSVQGTLISNTLNGSGTFEYAAFQGNLPTVPEPSAITLIGAAAVTVVLRRKR